MENVPTNWINLKSKANKLDFDKLLPASVDLSKISGIVKNYVVKKMYIMLRSKLFKIKSLILLTMLLMLLLMLK